MTEDVCYTIGILVSIADIFLVSINVYIYVFIAYSYQQSPGHSMKGKNLPARLFLPNHHHLAGHSLCQKPFIPPAFCTRSPSHDKPLSDQKHFALNSFFTTTWIFKNHCLQKVSCFKHVTLSVPMSVFPAILFGFKMLFCNVIF